MLRKEETKMELARDENRAKKFTEMVESLRGKILGTLTERCEVLQKRLAGLMDAKRGILEAPVTKGEMLGLAKEALGTYKQKFGIERFLADNLSKSMLSGGAHPLRVETLKELILRHENWPQMVLFSMVDDRMLEDVVSALPEPANALSSSEREKALKKLDGEILNLENLLTKESAAAAAATAKAVEED